MDKITILVVEDDNDINHILSSFLDRAGYATVSAYSGTEALLQFSMNTFDLILLDLMLPGMTGENMISEIRKKKQTPIIVISAKIALEDKVNALKNGADDYITKPFERDEVLARVDAVLRRSRVMKAEGSGPKSNYKIKQLVLSSDSREVFVKGNLLPFTAYEFDLLLLLMQNPERVYTKEQLYQEIWKTGYYGEDNTINVHISNIRKKIKEFDDSSYIKTVWGIGFKLDTAD